MAKANKHLRVHTDAGIIEIPDVDEYVCGYKYFWIKPANKNPHTIKRSVIDRVERKRGGKWVRVNLKKHMID